jgi:hypothetical protein
MCEQRKGVDNWLFAIGFITALVLALLSLGCGAVYLWHYLDKCTALLKSGTDPHLLALSVSVIKVALLSCGVFVGMAFGFLGFALFLLGVRDDMDLEAKGTDRQGKEFSLRLIRLAPGTLVLLCAAVLIGVCCTHRIEMSAEGESPTPRGGVQAGESTSGSPVNSPGNGPNGFPEELPPKNPSAPDPPANGPAP